MMRIILLLVVVCIISGCHKIMDHYDVESSNKTPPCRLSSITYSDFEDETVTVKYYYDNNGKPTAITHPDPDIGEYSEDFTYDNLGRLKYYSTYIYAGEDKIYVYEGNSRLPVRDTTIDIWGRKYTETFQYDDAGRIIQVDRKWAWSPPGLDEDLGDPRFEEELLVYYYDLRGNRQDSPLGPFPNPLMIYTDKPNLNSLNPVFQLLYRDYSRNSRDGNNVETFNEYGLPLTFEKSSSIFEYDCE